MAKGIHWHIAQDVEYVALDPDKQKIALIEVRDANGKVKAAYGDPTAGISRADADKMPRRRMDCIDCHNAAGHPFGNPANLVDDALEEGSHRSQPAFDQGALGRDHPEGSRDLGAGRRAREEVHGADRGRGAARRAGSEGEGSGAEVRGGNEAHPAPVIVRGQGHHVEDLSEQCRAQGLPRVASVAMTAST